MERSSREDRLITAKRRAKTVFVTRPTKCIAETVVLDETAYGRRLGSSRQFRNENTGMFGKFRAVIRVVSCTSRKPARFRPLPNTSTGRQSLLIVPATAMAGDCITKQPVRDFAPKYFLLFRRRRVFFLRFSVFDFAFASRTVQPCRRRRHRRLVVAFP